MPLQNKQEHGFILAMARELLVHNPDIKTVDQAISMASDLISQSHTHTNENSDGRMARR
jgi:hypothetical protein